MPAPVRMFLLQFANYFVIAIALFSPQAQAADPASDCVALKSERWTPQEVWIWEQLCAGETADLNVRDGLEEELDALTAPLEDWTDTRKVSTAFLRDILLYSPFVDALRNKPVRISGAWFAEPIRMQGAHLQNYVALVWSRFDETLRISNGTAASRFMVWRSWFRKSFRFHVMDGYELLLLGSRFDGDVIMWGVNSARAIAIEGSEFNGYVNLTGSKARNITIGRHGNEPKWGPDAQLSLRMVEVETLEDTPGSWDGLDGRLDLQGLRYKNLGGWAQSFDRAEAAVTAAERPLSMLLGWIERQESRDEHYIPHPYEQLAAALVEAGQSAKARRVLYAKNEYKRKHATTGFGDRVWLTIKKVIIGYGYQIWLTVLWGVVLIVVGAGLVYRSSIGRSLGIGGSLLYSCDQALPLIYLNPKHEDVAMRQSRKLDYYFQVHQLLSLILLSFLGAGLA
ncbi:MAG: hypothetical protein OET16_08845, partial [Chromatiales bacterium]|nr:hypothetical protein [Chromatiales bacterium]